MHQGLIIAHPVENETDLHKALLEVQLRSSAVASVLGALCVSAFLQECVGEGSLRLNLELERSTPPCSKTPSCRLHTSPRRSLALRGHFGGRSSESSAKRRFLKLGAHECRVQVPRLPPPRLLVGERPGRAQCVVCSDFGGDLHEQT